MGKTIKNIVMTKCDSKYRDSSQAGVHKFVHKRGSIGDFTKEAIIELGLEDE